jgi:hypothetical protein
MNIIQATAYDAHAMYALCRGEAVEPPPAMIAAGVTIRTVDQVCKLDSSRHPSLNIAPLKV